MMKRTLVRVGLTLFLAVAAASILVPRLTGFESNYAIVNAPLITVRAPFDGSIVSGSPSLARPFKTGDILIDLRSTHTSETELARLTYRRSVLSGQIAAIDEERLRVVDLQLRLKVRLEQEKDAATLQMEAEMTSLRAELSGAVARISRIEREIERAVTLSNRNVFAQAELEGLRYNRREALADQQRIEAKISEQKHMLRSARATGFVTTGDPAHSTTQRMDEVELRLTNLDSQRAFLAAEIEGIQPLADAIRREGQRLERFRPAAPTNGVVWAASRSERTMVAEGDELLKVLDCSRRYVEVALSERHFERIKPGTIALIKLRGSNETWEAPVTSLRGSAERIDGGGIPAIERSEVLTEFTLFIDMEPVDPNRVELASAFCDVGRSAAVRFVRPAGAAIDRVVNFLAGWSLHRNNVATNAAEQSPQESGRI